jgi:prepilin-type N-terminal cleavage/methylation domain-containing protein
MVEDAMMRSALPATAPPRASSVHRPRRGFTLIELLVTCALIALAALIGLIEVQKAFKKLAWWPPRRTSSSSRNGPTSSCRSETLQFLYLAPYDVDLGTPLLIVEDRNGNGFPDKVTEVDTTLAGAADSDGVTRQRMYVIPTGVDPLGSPRDISLSQVNIDQVQSLNWSYYDSSNPPASAGPVSNVQPRWIRCDFVGRTANDNCGMTSSSGTPVCRLGMQLPAPATLVLTHRDMVGGTLTPSRVHTINVSPAWSVYATRTP